MNVLIITGASKGIGAALTSIYLKNNFNVYTLSRSNSNQNLAHHTPIDLSNVDEISLKFTHLIKVILKEKITSITLINNAGRLGDIAPLVALKPKNIIKSMHLNSIAPILLSSIFMQSFKDFTGKKKIINISSGAATKPYFGWSTYCASKASLDMLTKSIALEQEEVIDPVQCYGIYPGVVDTDMQLQIRQTSLVNFKNKQRFIDLKNNNELYTTEHVAQTIFKIDSQNRLKNGEIIDLRNYSK